MSYSVCKSCAPNTILSRIRSVELVHTILHSIAFGSELVKLVLIFQKHINIDVFDFVLLKNGNSRNAIIRDQKTILIHLCERL